MSTNITTRHASIADLKAINQVIETAIMTWDLPERVKRLSLSSYYYSKLDFDHLDIIVAEDGTRHIVGVAAWEPADVKDAPEGRSALLLHGLYVDPAHQQQGIGRQLFREAENFAQRHHYNGLLVKAQENASGFFISQGLKKLPVEDTSRHYANRFWKALIETT